MYTVVIEALKQWNRVNDRHTKLQHIYVMAALVILVIAGLVGLINYRLGQNLLIAAAALLAIFFVNAVAWALADSFIVSRLTRRTTKRQ